jgi:Tol biopolymer transport system component
MQRIVLLLASMVAALVLVSGAGLSSVVKPAEATAPGVNGRIVADRDLDFSELLTMNPDGTSKTPIGPGSIGQAAWSPDGSKIAFVKMAGEQIYVVNADGSDERQLTSFPDNVYEPTWSPDGTKIAF